MNNITIASHRRSGTHLLIEFLKKNWKLNCNKTHDFYNLNSNNTPLYIIRNPREVLHSTYIWFTVVGGSHNPIINNFFKTLTFEDYILGAAGELVGYDCCFFGDKDNLYNCNGMFYDPIRYWIDHANSYYNSYIIRYEDLVNYNNNLLASLQLMFGALPKIEHITELVGHTPTSVALNCNEKFTDHRSAWTNKTEELLVNKINKYAKLAQLKNYA